MVIPRLTFEKGALTSSSPKASFLHTPYVPHIRTSAHSIPYARPTERERESAFNQSEMITCGAVVIAGKTEEEGDGVCMSR